MLARLAQLRWRNTFPYVLTEIHIAIVAQNGSLIYVNLNT